MGKTSQCDRVLDVLRDGRWHRMEEIHARAGFMRLNSRVSELRARGLDIRCDRAGGVYKYRLVDGLEEGAPSRSVASSSSPLPQPSEKVSSDSWASGNSEGSGSDAAAAPFDPTGLVSPPGPAPAPSSSSPLPTPAVDCSPLPGHSDHGTAGAGSGRAAEKRPAGRRPVQTCGSSAPPEQMSLLEAA
jgi:hypothetical protein